MGENAQSLTERYHRAAEKLNFTCTPGKGGLTQAPQLFLTASWLESEVVEPADCEKLCPCCLSRQQLDDSLLT